MQIENLSVEFRTFTDVVKAVNGISYSLASGQTLAILGESGSGKTVSSLATLGLLESPPAKITSGRILYRDLNLLEISARKWREIRGEKIAMIFQDALSSLNPVYPVGEQIAEMYRMHRGLGRSEAKKRALEMLERVHIPSATKRFNDYPHQFSGGMRQRVMIAVAIALDPEILIADEPTTALDVTVQAQVMELLKELQNETGMSVVLITHDLGVVAEVVESGPIEQVFSAPAHPYTLGLLQSIPSAKRKVEQLHPIRGAPPNLGAIPVGCPFHPRCDYREDKCRSEMPELRWVATGRKSACHFAERILDD
ncbi:MAG: ATP-binding cassette domain-containing protein [Actinobacteria bacterium]|nr:ATP-binding cassette domain-containing protein [Actinomycetota bacterium]